MADSTTPIYGLVLPEVGASTDTWGTKLNSDATQIEQEIARARLPFLSPTVGATTTLDLNQTTGGRVFVFTVSQATTIAVTNPPAATFFARVLMRIANGGAFAVTWPASFDWSQGTAPTLTASGVDWVEAFTIDAGVTWHAQVVHMNADTALNPRASVYRTTAVAGAEAAVAFDNERYDVGAMHDNAVNNSRLTVPASQGGLYHILFHAPLTRFTGTVTGRIRFRKNGATILRDTSIVSTVAGEWIQVSGYEVLAAADYVEIMATTTGDGGFENAGGSLTQQDIAFELVRVR